MASSERAESATGQERLGCRPGPPPRSSRCACWPPSIGLGIRASKELRPRRAGRRALACRAGEAHHRQRPALGQPRLSRSHGPPRTSRGRRSLVLGRPEGCLDRGWYDSLRRWSVAAFFGRAALQQPRRTGGGQVSEASTEVTIPSIKLDLEQLVGIVRGLDESARARVAQALAETEMDARLGTLIERLASRAPAAGVTDAAIHGEVDAVRRRTL